MPRNDDSDYKALEVNQKLPKMCKETKLDYMDNKNINTRKKVSKSRLLLNQHGSNIMDENFSRKPMKKFFKTNSRISHH